jgi:hypothetical protein
MSAPKTNIDKQVKRHRGPIWGITIGLILVAAVAVAALFWSGVPLDEQAAPDGEPTETINGGDTVTAPELDTPAASDAATGTDGASADGGAQEPASQ